MKKALFIMAYAVAMSLTTLAQDVPVYSQKLTNSFLYNPSVAGNTLGSATLSYRQQWTGATGSPQTTFFSLHTPFAQHKMGTGFNVYRETAGVNDNLFASAAFAYHVRFTDHNLLSMGASGEVINSRINFSRVDALDMDDIYIAENQSALTKVDFSFGMSFSSKFLKVGASANRITSLTSIVDSLQQFPAFYSGYANVMLPLAGDRDLLEPLVFLRNLSNGKYQFDAGLYYTYNNRVTLGAAYRTGGAVSLTGAFRLGKSMYLGYSREMLSGNYGASLEHPTSLRCVSTFATIVTSATSGTRNGSIPPRSPYEGKPFALIQHVIHPTHSAITIRSSSRRTMCVRRITVWNLLRS